MEAIYVSIQKGYRQVFPFLKVGLTALLLGGIFYQLAYHNNLKTIFNEFLSSFWEGRASYLCLAFGLMPFNLVFETRKWLEFTRFFYKMGFWQAYRAVFAGMSLAVITPNRIGEYGGRLLLMPAKVRGRLAISMLFSNYCQWIVLFFGGLIGFCWFAFNQLHWQLYLICIIMVAGGLACVLLLLLLFLQIGWILPFFGKCGLKKWGRFVRRQLLLLRTITPRVRWRALQWAALRYLTYSLQYWYLLQFFGIKVNLIEGLAGIASIFLIQTGVPLSAGLALLARGEIAVFVWSHFGANEISVLAATFVLFIINLILPALLGAIILVQRNDSKSLDYEKDTA